MAISSVETTVEKRGFRECAGAQQARLETIGTSFLAGYHAALEKPVRALAGVLDETPREYRGFAYEGAAMSLCLLDSLVVFGGGRLKAFLAGSGDRHIYMAHVGAGWAFARLPWTRTRMESMAGKFDPLHFPLVLDGYGFHEGYFSWKKSIRARAAPKGLSREGRHFFDQGLGRSLWFVEGANPGAIAASLNRFDVSRRGDLWSGVGLACAYAGAVAAEEVELLRALSGEYRMNLAQGAAFAAEARHRAGNMAAHTDEACHVLCGMSAEQASALTLDVLADMKRRSGPERYREWQIRLQEKYRLFSCFAAAAR